jgi:hypothetical protein
MGTIGGICVIPFLFLLSHPLLPHFPYLSVITLEFLQLVYSKSLSSNVNRQFLCFLFYNPYFQKFASAKANRTPLHYASCLPDEQQRAQMTRILCRAGAESAATRTIEAMTTNNRHGGPLTTNEVTAEC